jgi:8-oxo-dGTP diphosphatase
MENSNFRFNIRVYGLIFNSDNELLIADEFVLNRYMTKFPGGGLEYGEGTIDCLMREVLEEMGMELENISHFYTTDFFQQALFFEETQLISIYYKATLKNSNLLKTQTSSFKLKPIEGSIAFRWVKLSEIDVSTLTFPIDRYVLKLLLGLQ